MRRLSPGRSTNTLSSTPSPKPTTQSSPPQLKKDLPPRSASAIPRPTQTPVQPAALRPVSAFDDLASLSGVSSNASLPLQYAVNPPSTQSTIQPFNPTNPYANLAVTPGVQPQSSPFSQPLSLPLQQNPTTSVQTTGSGGGLQPSFGGVTPGYPSIPQSQSTNLLTPQGQQFNTGATFGSGLNSMNGLQPQFSSPAFSNQTFLSPHQQMQSFLPQQPQQPGSGMLYATYPGQTQGFQQLTPNATGNPFYAMQQQQQLQQMQPTGYVQQQQTFGMGVSPTNPFGQSMQHGNPFSPTQTQGWQNGGFPAQQQQWG